MKISELTKDHRIHCPTEELAKQVLMIAHDHGYMWADGNDFTYGTQWSARKEYTVYDIIDGTFADISWGSESNTIINAEDFIESNTVLTKDDLVEGEVYLYDNFHITRFPHGAFITGNTRYESRSSWFWTQPIRKATPDEIKWLEACEKANKFIPKEEALKQEYKVGDWVVCVNDTTTLSKLGSSGYGYKHQLCFEVTEKHDHANTLWYGSNGVYIDQVRPARKKEIEYCNGKNKVLPEKYQGKVLASVLKVDSIGGGARTDWLNLSGDEAEKILKQQGILKLNINNNDSKKGKAIKVNRLVSRVRRGEKPEGRSIVSRSRKATTESRSISYSASVIKS